jgi:hypothetical protein
MLRSRLLVFIAFAACGKSSNVGVDGAVTDGAPDADSSGVRIIRGAPDQTHWADLDVVASGWSTSEGAPVVIQVGMPERPPERLGLGNTRVLDGGFQLTFPAVLEDGLYKRKVVWIDVDRDGRCGAPDVVTTNYAFGTTGIPLVWNVAPGVPDLPGDCSLIEANWPTE